MNFFSISTVRSPGESIFRSSLAPIRSLMLSAPLVSLVLGLLPVHVRLNSVVDLGHVDSQVGLDIQLLGVVIEHADLAG